MSYTKRHQKPAEVPSELRQALLAFVEEMSLKVNVEFDVKDYSVTTDKSGVGYRVGITNFATFVKWQKHRSCGGFKREIPLLTDRGQICYAVSAFELPNDFVKVVPNE